MPFVHFTLSSPSKHFGTLFLVIVELYQGPEDPPGPSWTPKWTGGLGLNKALLEKINLAKLVLFGYIFNTLSIVFH